MRKLLALTITLAFVSCAHTSQQLKGPPQGYCFKADGLSKVRCYQTKTVCLEKTTALSDQHPWAKIEEECFLHNPPLPGN